MLVFLFLFGGRLHLRRVDDDIYRRVLVVGLLYTSLSDILLSAPVR